MKLSFRLVPILATVVFAATTAQAQTTFKIRNTTSDAWQIKIEDYKNSYGKAYFKNPTDLRVDPPSEEMKDKAYGINAGSAATVTLEGNTLRVFDIIFTLQPYGGRGKAARFEAKTGTVYGVSSKVLATAEHVTFSDTFPDGTNGAYILIK